MLIECIIDFKNILQWKLDLTKGQGTGKICSLFRGFVISKYIPLINQVFGPYCKLRTEFFPINALGP